MYAALTNFRKSFGAKLCLTLSCGRQSLMQPGRAQASVVGAETGPCARIDRDKGASALSYLWYSVRISPNIPSSPSLLRAYYFQFSVLHEPYTELCVLSTASAWDWWKGSSTQAPENTLVLLLFSHGNLPPDLQRQVECRDTGSVL